MYEFASHCIDLVVFFFGKPTKVTGSLLKSIYSANVEDLVSSSFVYANGLIGNIFVNWSDPSYRKPTNVIVISGTNGKIVADKHAYKIYLREADKEKGFEKGWNTRYITEFARNVRFYVRGNEFTRQLDYFVDAILNKSEQNICAFMDGHVTDEIIHEIKKDASGADRDRDYTNGFDTTKKIGVRSGSIKQKLFDYFVRK